MKKIREKTKKKIIVIEIITLIILSVFVTSLLIANSESNSSNFLRANLEGTNDFTNTMQNEGYRKTGLYDPYYQYPEQPRPFVSASAHPRNGMAPLTVRFSAYAYGYTGWITYISWIITGPEGYSEYSNEWNPEFTFETPGRYQAYVTVRDHTWSTASSFVYVNVYDPTKPARLEMFKGFPLILSTRIFFVNQEDEMLKDINYNIRITGGLFNRLSKTTSGTINSLEKNDGIAIRTPRVWFAFGRGSLELDFEIPNRESITEKHTLFYFGPFFIIV